MILSDQTIRENRIVSPCEERGVFRGMSFGLSSCGYDVRADLSKLSIQDERDACAVMVDGTYRNGIRIPAGRSVLIGISEHFSVPPWAVGIVKDKSTWARRGLLVGQAVLEPGWRGYMCVRVYNAGIEALTLCDGDPVAQVMFESIDQVPERTYSGKYQGESRDSHEAKYE